MLFSAEAFRLCVLTKLKFAKISLGKGLDWHNFKRDNNGEVSIFSCPYVCFEASGREDVMDSIKNFLKHRTLIALDVTIVDKQYRVHVTWLEKQE